MSATGGQTIGNARGTDGLKAKVKTGKKRTKGQEETEEREKAKYCLAVGIFFPFI